MFLPNQFFNPNRIFFTKKLWEWNENEVVAIGRQNKRAILLSLTRLRLKEVKIKIHVIM